MPQTKTFVLLSRSFFTWLIVCISSDTEPSTQKVASQHMGAVGVASPVGNSSTMKLLIWKILSASFCTGRILYAAYAEKEYIYLPCCQLKQLCPRSQKTERVLEC